MQKILLGNTGLSVTKTAMGCLPIQRRSAEDAAAILRAAYEGGINYFDTANSYTDSEEKIGLALSDVREHIVISTKSQGRDKATAATHIDLSLKRMKMDYIDLFQFHMVPAVPDINDPEGAFAAALEAKQAGKIRHIGVTTHKLDVAEACIESGNFETLQYPFSYISSERERNLPRKCAEKGMGFIAMKGLAGGMLSNARVCHAFMKQYDNVVPIWGIQHMAQLEEWLALAEEDPSLDDEMRAIIEKDRKELARSFCRSCGYCMPCTVGIEINNCARMDMLLRRSPYKPYLTPEWRAKMNKINDCIGCGICKSRCPYELDTPNVLKYMLKDYNEFYEAHKDEL